MSTALESFSDQEIIHLLAKDQKKVLDFIFDRYYTELCRHAYRYTGKEEIAEEITQDIFVYLWEKRKDINISTSLKAYLYKAVSNRSINHLKSQFSRQKFEEIEGDYLTVSHRNTEEQLNYEELNGILQEGISRLPDRCRTIFNLSRNGGLTYQDIAKELGISPKTVEVQMGIALKKLREYLGDHWETVAIFLLLFY